MSAIKQIEKEIREAYTFLRENNNTIPSETLSLMLDSSLEKLSNSGISCKCGNQMFTHRHSNWIECTSCHEIKIIKD